MKFRPVRLLIKLSSVTRRNYDLEKSAFCLILSLLLNDFHNILYVDKTLHELQNMETVFLRVILLKKKNTSKALSGF